MKTKILMTVLAMFFMVAAFTGNTNAAPIDISVTYIDSGDRLNFTITNNSDNFSIAYFGLEYNGTALLVPAGMEDQNKIVPGATGFAYHKFWFTSNHSSTDLLYKGETISGLIVPDSNLAAYHFYALGYNAINTTNALALTAAPRATVYYGTVPGTAVPEPTTLLLLGLGLVGMAGLKKKIVK